MSAAAFTPFETEATALGLQTLVPGVQPVSMKTRLEMLAAHPLGSDKLQKPCNIGLFDDGLRNQMDLLSANNPNPHQE